MSYLTAIARTRHEILSDNEKPVTLLVSVNLKHALLDELTTPSYGRPMLGNDVIRVMGMAVEWTKAVPLTRPQISIRTAKGDTRIVSYSPQSGER